VGKLVFVNWISIVSLIGAAQGCFIAYLVLAYGRQKKANLWLGLYVSAYAALCLGDALSHSSLLPRYPDVTALFDFCVFLLGPLLYQYVRLLTGRKSLGSLLWVHLIPACFVLLVQVLFHILPMDAKRSAVASQMESHQQLDIILVVAAMQILAYLVATLVSLRDYARHVRQNYSSFEKRSLTWLKNLVLVNCALWLVWAITVFTHSPVVKGLDYVGFPLAAYILAAFAVRAPEVLASPGSGGEMNETAERASNHSRSQDVDNPPDTESIQPVLVEREASTEKYRTSRLPEPVVRRYEAKLTSLMSEKKPYLENDLTLSQLAERLAIPTHHLSQLLNERLGVSFFDYVNRLRVEEVKRLLRDPEKDSRSILDLAFEAGFSSKSSFNSIFKRSTGYSPSTYRKLSPFSSISQQSRTSNPTGEDDTTNISA
jgi:AraC-like DNA-binding protein